MVRVSEARRGRRRACEVWGGRSAEERARGRRHVCLSLLSVVCSGTWSSAQRAVRPEWSTLDNATFVAYGPSSWPHRFSWVKISTLGLRLLLSFDFPLSPVLFELTGARRHRCTTASSCDGAPQVAEPCLGTARRPAMPGEQVRDAADTGRRDMAQLPSGGRTRYRGTSVYVHRRCRHAEGMDTPSRGCAPEKGSHRERITDRFGTSLDGPVHFAALARRVSPSGGCGADHGDSAW